MFIVHFDFESFLATDNEREDDREKSMGMVD